MKIKPAVLLFSLAMAGWSADPPKAPPQVLVRPVPRVAAPPQRVVTPAPRVTAPRVVAPAPRAVAPPAARVTAPPRHVPVAPSPRVAAPRTVVVDAPRVVSQPRTVVTGDRVVVRRLRYQPLVIARVRTVPPLVPLIEEQRRNLGVAPGARYVFIPGYFSGITGDGWAWVDPVWALPPTPTAVWISPYWVNQGGEYQLQEGYWIDNAADSTAPDASDQQPPPTSDPAEPVAAAATGDEDQPVQPPPPADPTIVQQMQMMTPSPGPGYVFLPGHYSWPGNPNIWTYIWMPGRWSLPPFEGAHWVADSWFQQNGRWVSWGGYWSL